MPPLVIPPREQVNPSSSLSEDEEILRAKVSLSYLPGTMVNFRATAAALAIWILGWSQNQHGENLLPYHLWLAIALTEIAARALTGKRFRAQSFHEFDLRREQRLVIVYAVLHAVIFGIGGYMVVSLEGPSLAIALVILTTIMASTSLTIVYMPLLSLFYCLSLFLPPFLKLYVSIDGMDFLFLSASVLSCVIAMTAQGIFYIDNLATAVRLRRQNEKAIHDLQSATSSRNQFLSAANHDIRQPMQSLMMWVDMGARKISDDAKVDVQFKRVFDGIHNSASTLDRLFSHLMQVSFFESGVVKVEEGPVDVTALLKSILARHRSYADIKKLKILCTPESSIVCLCDRAILERVCGNLINNAFHYTTSGYVWVHTDIEDGRLRISVMDSGQGVAPEDHARLFNDFYRSDRSSAANPGGYGIGLAAVKRLADLAGITLIMDSTLGEGSCFAIEFDYHPASIDRPKDAPPGAILSDGLLAILVEDDADVRNSLSHAIRSFGMDVAEADSYPAYVEIMESIDRPPAVVVTDYMLDTRGSGIDVIRHARSQYGDELPCLIITGDPINAGGMSLPAGVKLAFKPVHYSSMLSILTSLLPAPADPA